MNAFAAAVNAIFADPNVAVDAEYRAGGGGSATVVRVIMRAPDAISDFNSARFISPAVFLGVKVSDLAAISAGDTFTIEGTVYTVSGEPTRDGERLTWEVEAIG